MDRETRKPDFFFEELTWEDIEDWAGSRVLARGRSYQRNVERLAVTPTGGLIATVQGGDEYTTLVGFEDGDLVSRCTCPYGSSCKHAVAIILEYLDRVRKGKGTPVLESRDERIKVFGEGADYSLEEDDCLEEGTAGYGSNALRAGKPPLLREYLEKLTKDELVGLLLEAAGKYPTVLEDLRHLEKLSKGRVKEIIEDVSAEILRLSSEPAWRSHWNDEGHIPDYSRVRNSLETLLALGHADAVITLGRELLTAGVRQVEMSDDEGETAEEISLCLEAVFRALPHSSLSPAKQILWAIDAELSEDYGLCDGSASFWEAELNESDWSKAADELLRRLKRHNPSADPQDDFSRDYARDRLSDWIVAALENAGRIREVVPLLEKEAIITNSYTRLVDALLKEGRKKDAERWIGKGIKALSEKYPGMAEALLSTLLKIREKEGNWPAVAALRAAEILRNPSFGTYDELRGPSDRAGIWPLVREGVLLYLETGKSPYLHASWPLPEPEVKLERVSPQDKPPMTHILIEIAIDEKRPDEIIRWYDSQPKKQRYFAQWGAHMEDRIAHGIKDAYPDRAAAIWKGLAEKQIALTKPSAYDVAAGHLKDLRKLLVSLNRGEEWTRYLASLRQIHARKSRLLQTLTLLEGKKIIDEIK